MIGDRFDVEEYRAGDMAVVIFGLRVALLRRQEEAAVDHDDIAVAQMFGQPFGRNEPTARGGGGKGIFGSEHGNDTNPRASETVQRKGALMSEHRSRERGTGSFFSRRKAGLNSFD